jgi:hypothetical protein
MARSSQHEHGPSHSAQSPFGRHLQHRLSHVEAADDDSWHGYDSSRDDSDEEVEECPVCCNDLDLTDKSIRYCECGFRPCLWCYHQILEEAVKDNLTPARCPNCRSEYDQNKISMQQDLIWLTFEWCNLI